MRALAVIPARRGSKRLPSKNILPLNGRPMLTYSIEAAQKSGVFESVYVSTEDAETAGIVGEWGAVVHIRPQALAGDLVSATEVCLDVERALRGAGQTFDAIVCLQPSSPLRSARDVRESWERFLASGADYLVSVTPVDPHYFHWAVHQTPEGWQMYFGDKFLAERPLLSQVYRPNGAIKIGRTRQLATTRHFLGKPLEVYVMPEERSIHVAEKFDFELAEYLMKRGNGIGLHGDQK